MTIAVRQQQITQTVQDVLIMRFLKKIIFQGSVINTISGFGVEKVDIFFLDA